MKKYISYGWFDLTYSLLIVNRFEGTNLYFFSRYLLVTQKLLRSSDLERSLSYIIKVDEKLNTTNKIWDILRNWLKNEEKYENRRNLHPIYVSQFDEICNILVWR